MIVTKDVFYDTLKKMDTYIPFEQSEGWCEFKSSDKSSIVYFVDNIDNPIWLISDVFIISHLSVV